MPDIQNTILKDELVAVFTYELLPSKGAHGQTVGADGSGTKCIIYTGDADVAANQIHTLVNKLQKEGRLGLAHVAWNDGLYSGDSISVVHCKYK